MAGDINKQKARQTRKNEGYFKWYATSGRAMTNKKKRMTRAFKRSKCRDKQLLDRMKALFGIKYEPRGDVYEITYKGSY